MLPGEPFTVDKTVNTLCSGNLLRAQRLGQSARVSQLPRDGSDGAGSERCATTRSEDSGFPSEDEPAHEEGGARVSLITARNAA